MLIESFDFHLFHCNYVPCGISVIPSTSVRAIRFFQELATIGRHGQRGDRATNCWKRNASAMRELRRGDAPGLDIVIPASNEAAWIGSCLDRLLASDDTAGKVRIVVAANGCRDETAQLARARNEAATVRGWQLVVLEIREGSKTGALNKADDLLATSEGPRIYLDADVHVEPQLLGQIRKELGRPEAAYVSGTSTVAPSHSWVTRAYTRIWTRLPYMADGVPGGALFAVNAAGRARWDTFPDIIADDTFVRLHFKPEERVGVSGRFIWPMPEGVANLVRVRRRADAGMRQISSKFPELMPNEGKLPISLRRIFSLLLKMPVSFCVYCTVVFVVRATPQRDFSRWSRGR